MAGRPPPVLPGMPGFSGGLENQSSNSNASLVESSGLGLTAVMRDFQDEVNEPVSPVRAANRSFSVFRRDKPLSFELLKLQNLPYPGSMTNYRIQCSNGFIRVHGLLLYAASQHIQDTFGNQESDGEKILEFLNYGVHDMAKIVFVLYTGSTVFPNARRSALVRIIKRFRCHEDQIELTVPLRYTRTYKETNLRQLEDMKVQVGYINPGGVEESYFVSANGDRIGQDHSLHFMPNLSFQQHNGARPSATFAGNSSRQPEMAAIPSLTCGECPGRENFHNPEDFQEHVQLTHGGLWNTDSAIRGFWDGQRAHNADEITRPILGGITPMVIRMSDRIERMSSGMHAPISMPIIPPSVRDPPSQYSSNTKRTATSSLANEPDGKKSKRDTDVNPPNLEPQQSTSDELRNLMSRKESGSLTHYWYCPFCHRRSYQKSIITRHISELHPRWDQEGETACEPVQRPTSRTSEKYKCLICPENGENSFCSASVTGLELHSRTAHGLVRLKHYVLQPRPKCRVCGKHHRKSFDKSESFFRHIHTCLQSRLGRNNGSWNAKTVPSPGPLSKNADIQLWYNKLYLETMSPNCNPAYLGRIDIREPNHQEPPLIVLDATPSPVWSPVVGSPPATAIAMANDNDSETRVQVPERRSKRKRLPTAKSSNKENNPNTQKKHSKGSRSQNLVASSPIQKKRRGRPPGNLEENKTSKLENQNLNRETDMAEVANTPTKSPRSDHRNTEMSGASLVDHVRNPHHDPNQKETERNSKPLYKRIVRVSSSNDSEDGQEGGGSDRWVVDETSAVPETPDVQTTPESRRTENSGRTLLDAAVPREGVVNPVLEGTEPEFLSASDVWFENVEEPGPLVDNNNSHSPVPLPQRTEFTNSNDENSTESLIDNRLPQDP